MFGKQLRPPHGRHLNTVADVAQRLQQKTGIALFDGGASSCWSSGFFAAKWYF
jgi:hypothetical protein